MRIALTTGVREQEGRAGSRRRHRELALIVLLLVGAGLVAALVAWAGDVSAQSVQERSKGGAPEADGTPAVPNACPSWNIVSAPNEGPSGLGGVAALSASNIWAVGYYESTSYRTLTMHWDGSAWSTVPSPNVAGYNNQLLSVAASSASNVWAVGTYYSAPYLNDMHSLTLHWNGTAWSRVASPLVGVGGILYGVSAISANNAWAVGQYQDSNSGRSLSLILHWNGTAWSRVSGPLVGAQDALNSVVALSASNIWAVGTYWIDANFQRTLILHWNGTAWSQVSSPDTGVNASNLWGLAAVSAGDIWAVGYVGAGQQYGQPQRTLILHWNGSSWHVVPSPDANEYDNGLLAIDATSASDIWAVGYYSHSSLRYQTLTLHWNGSAWSQVSSPNLSSDNSLTGVAAVSASNIWAVGVGNGSILAERYYCPPAPTNTPIPTPGTPTATTVPFPTQCAINFADVPNPSTFYPYVQCLACRGIIGGYACGGANEPCDPNNDPYFRPNGNLTRGQVAKILAKAAGITDPVSGQSFQDVPVGSTFYTYTQQLYTRGVLSGFPCGGTNEPCVPPANLPYFRPGSTTTRGQLAKLDSNTAGFNDPPSGQHFQDIPIASTYYNYTSRLATRGVMSGFACGGTNEPCVPPANLPYFRPNVDVKRGQTSKIVANTFYPNCQAP